MDCLQLSVEVHAPLERCFVLATNVALVQQTLGMKQLSGPASVTAGSRVVWRGWKFGLRTTHHTLITAFEAPALTSHEGTTLRRAFFQDSQEAGRFANFHHDHFFEQALTPGAPTVMEDRIYFELPFGVLGRLASETLLRPHIRKLAHERFALLKRLAESKEEWQPFMPAPE